MSTPNIVSGRLSSWAELEKDEPFLQGWLKDAPSRLGLGDLVVADGEPVQDDHGNPAFIAGDDDTYFEVDVRLGEMDATGGFGLLDNWARNRVRHPDKTHVAVLVTEAIGERYRTTLEALSEHLPLVVVELQVWRGENEAILVPRVALSSKDVDLSDAPAVRSARAVVDAAPAAPPAELTGEEQTADAPAEAEHADDTAEHGDEQGEHVPENKDDTGVTDPWGLPKSDAEPAEAGENGSGKRLLTKIGT